MRDTPMKKLLLICILFQFAGTLMAQDIITTKEGKDIKAKVLEISSTEIKYLDYENLEGPTYIMNRSDVLIIRYQNGKNEVFNEPSEPQAETYLSTLVMEGMDYQDYKNLYNHRNYKRQMGDPYNPTLAGIASFLIPGLGQGLCDEWGRGAAFFGGHVFSLCATAIFVTTTTANSHHISPAPVIILVAGSAVTLACDIASIVDAVRVAKIKNMYYRDLQGLRQANIDVNLTPCFTYIYTPEANTPVMGLSLNIGF